MICEGNDIADHLSKEAATESNLYISFKLIPKSSILEDLNKSTLEAWQEKWSKTTKGAVTKTFFPSVIERLKLRIGKSIGIGTLLSGHGRIRSYYHRFKIKENPEYICQNGDQTIEHVIHVCKELDTERQQLKNEVLSKSKQWPVANNILISEYYSQFVKFVNNIDFDILVNNMCINILNIVT